MVGHSQPGSDTNMVMVMLVCVVLVQDTINYKTASAVITLIAKSGEVFKEDSRATR